MSFFVKWIGQGGFIVRAGGMEIAIDPYLSDDIFVRTGACARRRPIPIEPHALRSDLVIATHDHDDHLDPATIAFANAKRYAGPDSCLAHYRALDISESSLAPLNRGDTIDLDGVRVTGVFAKHTKDSIGVVIECDGIKAYFSGDTLYADDLIAIGDLGIDVALLCINGRLGNMNHIEAARLAGELKCRLAFPHHYDMFAENSADPEDFFAALDPSIRSMLLRFDEEIDLVEVLES